MKIGALGLVTVAIGVALSSTGLVGIGAFWVVMGVVGHTLRPRMVLSKTETSAPPRKKILLGVAVMLAVGIPSLVVGILSLGIDGGDSAWRWLPIGVGIVAAGFGASTALLLGAASGLSAATGADKAKVPATVWVRSMQETGTFVNERPRLEFELRVEPDPGSGMAGFEVTKKATVPFTAMGSLRVGDGFRAEVVGPDDADAMDIDWDSPVGGATGDVSERLAELDRLLKDEQITGDEYRTQRQRILGSL